MVLDAGRCFVAALRFHAFPMPLERIVGFPQDWLALAVLGAHSLQRLRADNNQLELGAAVDVNKANVWVKSINTGLSKMERAAQKAVWRIRRRRPKGSLIASPTP